MTRFVKGAGRNKAQYSFFRISARCQLGNSDGRVGNDHITLTPWASMATFQCVFSGLPRGEGRPSVKDQPLCKNDSFGGAPRNINY